MRDAPRLPLLCGLCPNRRVLMHLSFHLIPDDDVVEGATAGPLVTATSTGHRKWRPSVEASPTADRIWAGEPWRLRCKKGHPWTFTQDELLGAYLAADAAGRRDVVAGVDIT